jgi:glycosyltransferase involved in cell wall biosynthesis
LKNLLLISHSSNLTGGGEDDFVKLLKHFHNKYIIYTIFPTGNRSDEYKKYSEKYLEVKGSVFPFTKFRFTEYIRFFYRNISKIFAICKFVKNNKSIDLCFLNSSVCFMEAIPLVLLKIPYILSVKEKINPKIIRNIIFYFYKKTAKKIITISKFLKNEIIEITDRKDVEIIYSTIEEKYFEEIFNKCRIDEKAKMDIRFKVLNIGSIYQMKGQDILIEALLSMKTKNILVEFVGNIIDKEYYLKMYDAILKKSIKDCVSFLGELNKSELIQKIIDSDCIVLTSKEEGQSLVLLEALYLEKPIITTNVGVVSEVIKDNINGLLYNFGDVTKLCELILKLRSDKMLYNKISSNCKKTYNDNFNSEISIMKFEKIFEESLIQ